MVSSHAWSVQIHETLMPHCGGRLVAQVFCGNSFVRDYVLKVWKECMLDLLRMGEGRRAGLVR